MLSSTKSAWPLGCGNSCDRPPPSHSTMAACSITVVAVIELIVHRSWIRAHFSLRYLLNEYRRSAISYSRRHTVRLNSTTTAAITSMLAANKGKFLAVDTALILLPRPPASRTWPLYFTISATMLAFHAPPAAVTQPVTKYGNTA